MTSGALLKDLATKSPDEQVARLQEVLGAHRSGVTFPPTELLELVRELPRMKDAQAWFLGWSVLQRAEALPEALQLAELLLSEPSSPDELRRDPAFLYLYEKDPAHRDLVVAKGLASPDPGVLVAAAGRIAPVDRGAAIRGVLDAYVAAAAWNAHDVFESVSAWIEDLASPELVSALEDRLRQTDDEDVREQLGEWIVDTRRRLERRA